MSLFEEFLHVEERFQRGSEATEQEIIDELRQACFALFAVVSCCALTAWHGFMRHASCCILFALHAVSSRMHLYAA